MSQLIGKERNKCQCRDIYMPKLNHEVLFAAEIFALELEERFTQETCYEYNMQISSFGMGQIGVKNAAKFYFDKELTQLDERNILQLDLIRQSPRFYTSDKGKENMKVVINSLISQRQD